MAARSQQREQQEYEAEQARREEQRTTRVATFDRILAAAPASFTAPQLRVVLRAIVNLDPYTFTDDLAAENDNEQRSAEELLLASIDATADEKLTAFALRLALSGHVGIPRENEFDFLTEAEAVFAPLKLQKKTSAAKAKKPTLMKPEERHSTKRANQQ